MSIGKDKVVDTNILWIISATDVRRIMFTDKDTIERIDDTVEWMKKDRVGKNRYLDKIVSEEVKKME